MITTRPESSLRALLLCLTLSTAMTGTTARAQSTTERVSVTSGGAQANASSFDPTVSADGGVVAFYSLAPNLVAGDTNQFPDVFVHETATGLTRRVSVDSVGAEGNERSQFASIADDGRYVVFQSRATNLVASDANDRDDVFRHDLATGTTELVSVDSAGVQGDGSSGNPDVSADGRFVAFDSIATNLVAGDTNDSPDVFVRDALSGTTTRVSVSSAGSQANFGAIRPRISNDGRFVAFESSATNLVANDSNGDVDVFVHDRVSGITVRVSVGAQGQEGNGSSFNAAISADGRVVAFESLATNLVSGDTNGFTDVFVRDLDSSTTERVSLSSSGSQGNGSSQVPAISGDARHVAFRSFASNLVPGDTNGFEDVIVRDRLADTTSRASVSTSGTQGNDSSDDPALSHDGRSVAFSSLADDLVSGDTNGDWDIFVREVVEIGTKYCAATANSTGAAADLAASGSASSAAGDLVLSSMPVPNQNGIFFHGANASQLPFGNGFLCATGGIVRGAVVQASANVAVYAYDNSDAKHSLAAFVGQTRHFQHWFRDPAAGGALFNTSNARSIVLLP